MENDIDAIADKLANENVSQREALKMVFRLLGRALTDGRMADTTADRIRAARELVSAIIDQQDANGGC